MGKLHAVLLVSKRGRLTMTITHFSNGFPVGSEALTQEYFTVPTVFLGLGGLEDGFLDYPTEGGRLPRQQPDALLAAIQNAGCPS